MFWLQLSGTYYEIKGKMTQSIAGVLSDDLLFTKGKEEELFGKKSKRKFLDQKSKQLIEKGF